MDELYCFVIASMSLQRNKDVNIPSHYNLDISMVTNNQFADKIEDE